INAVVGLDRLAVRDGALRVGACVRHAEFHRPVVDGPLGVMLASIVRHIAHYPIRMRGTFCGSLAHADPAAEWCVVAAALDARLVLRSSRGERVLAADQFFDSVLSTALSIDEILIEARITDLPAGCGIGFSEVSRRPGDFAIAMAFAAVVVEEGKIVSCRLALGGVGNAPIRDPRAERALLGAALNDEAARA